ncbi:uncharacterized protein LOC116617899 isoform X2 [Nematostella vectensis]|uniref:uncharacterized protein LOC116617899 isoform X2 n=1 Tax=Nematostella vectensis TaxID=45351 RepID=UPI0020778BE2|nr:uncharacterized protein LOC116617899 isoform X2 [Nematostella vectensis]
MHGRTMYRVPPFLKPLFRTPLSGTPGSAPESIFFYNHPPSPYILPLFYQIAFYLTRWITNNRLKSVGDWLKYCSQLQLLHVSNNYISEVNSSTVPCPRRLQILILSNNRITHLKQDAFVSARLLEIIILDRNLIQELDISVFPSPSIIQVIIHQDSSINFQVHLAGHPFTKQVFAGNGYTCATRGGLRGPSSLCNPCPVGTYMGEECATCCIKCPAGGFYQDEIAQIQINEYGNGCKRCPLGRYASQTGTSSEQDCQACLEGTKHDYFAGFRACFCSDNHFRFSRFGPCFPCPAELLCRNESFILAPGYYWQWRSNASFQNFIRFTSELLIRDDSYDRDVASINVSEIPLTHKCPRAESCLGGLNAECAEGYGGPLCANCAVGHYKFANWCLRCPSVATEALQASGVVVSYSVLFILSSLKPGDPTNRYLTDSIISMAKIVVGFYQVVPNSIESMQSENELRYFEIFILRLTNVFKLDLLNIFPFECHMFGAGARRKFIWSMAVYSFIIALALVLCWLPKTKRLYNVTEAQSHFVNARTSALSCVFILLIILYPPTIFNVFAMLPESCQEICLDVKDESCTSYLSNDFTTECSSKDFKSMSLFVYASTVIMLMLPLLGFLLIRRALRKEVYDDDIKNGMRSLYINYTPSCYYWEMVEMYRRALLMAVIVFAVSDNGLFLCFAGILFGMYATLFAFKRPMKNTHEHWLQLMSILIAMVAKQIALLVKIPVEEEESANEIHSTDVMYFNLVTKPLFVLVVFGYALFGCLGVVTRCRNGQTINVSSAAIQHEDNEDRTDEQQNLCK